VGRVPPKRIAAADARYEAERPEHVCYKKQHWHHEDGLITEYVVKLEEPSELGLASVSNCHNSEVRRYGLKGISARGRTSVREGAYLLERKYGRRLGFYTLTCPYTDEISIYSYNQNINYIQRAFFQELKREYERQGCSWAYTSVIEIQAERFSDTGVPVLHIHYIAPCYIPSTYSWVVTADTLRSLWGRVLFNVLGGRVDVNASVDASVVRTSAVGYISKYMSKGSKETHFLAEVCPDQLPSQWWSMSQNVRKAIKSATIRLPQEICESILYNPCTDPSSPLYLRYYKFVYIHIRGEEKLVGLSGNMLPIPAYNALSSVPLSLHLYDL
jgi:hypothetical protein